MQIDVVGRSGRMGTLIAEEVAAAGHVLAAPGEVAIDFTHASAVRTHAAAFTSAGIAWVLGTTGLAAEDQAAVDAASRQICVVQAANFSTGVNLLIGLAERLGRMLPADEYDAEILEMHHRQKVDAPSGTALALGEAVARGRGADFGEQAILSRAGQTGLRPPGAIGFAALRGGQVVGEHTLLFASASEHLAVTHRAFDRQVFARGALRAALWTQGQAPGLYSMMDVLGLKDQ